jgi:hypothetical protein
MMAKIHRPDIAAVDHIAALVSTPEVSPLSVLVTS